MGFYKRGLLYLRRKCFKTVILAVLLAVVASLLLVSVAIWHSTGTAMQDLRNTMGGYFKIEANTAQGYKDHVSDELVEYIMENNEIKAFNGIDILYVLVNGIALEPGRFTLEGDEKANLARLIGTTESANDEYFALKALVLKEGGGLQAGDTNKALISENIAKINSLSVGDTIKIRNYGEQVAEKTDYCLEIAGIYSIQRTQNEKKVSTAECDMVENFVFVNTDCIRNMLRGTGGKSVDSYAYGAVFYVNDPDKLDSIVGKLEKDLNGNGEKYIFTKNNKTYEGSASALEKINGIAEAMMLVFFAAGSVILSLVLILMMRDRFHETGIFISMGLKKIEIISQHMFENMVVAVVAFCIAWILVNISATVIEDSLKSAVQSQAVDEESRFSGTESKIMQKDIDIDIRIGLPESIKILGMELLVATVSTGISSVFVVKLKPREILSLMS